MQDVTAKFILLYAQKKQSKGMPTILYSNPYSIPRTIKLRTRPNDSPQDIWIYTWHCFI